MENLIMKLHITLNFRYMKINRIVLAFVAMLTMTQYVCSQDQKTTETVVADLLARMPAGNIPLTDSLMEQMISSGEPVLRQICSQIIPAGTGDDTKARFAVASYSRYLSAKGNENVRPQWEKICIDYVKNSRDAGVKDFFMKQLQLAGSEASAEAVKEYLHNKDLCDPAIGVILKTGGKNAETILAEAIKDRGLPCVAGVMNALASLNSSIAVKDYIDWATVVDVNTRAAALYALARSGDPLAYPVLSKAAAEVGYLSDIAGATPALLEYAMVVGEKGDMKKMDKITRTVMSKTKQDRDVQNKSAALSTYAKFHGYDAMAVLRKAVANANLQYRMAALNASMNIPGDEAMQYWINYYRKAPRYAKPQIIYTFGKMKVEPALPLINSALSDNEQAIRVEAAQALAAISRNEAISPLITYMMVNPQAGDQIAAARALMTVMRNEDIRFLLPVLKEGNAAAKSTAIGLLAWKKDPQYFSDVFAFTTDSNEMVRTVALRALPYLAGPGDEKELLDLLMKTNDSLRIPEIQRAVAMASEKSDDKNKSALIIERLQSTSSEADKLKLLPVLELTGGKEALAVVMKEFENGNPDIRKVSFKTLTSWPDWTATSALFDILSSGNKTYEDDAFTGYINQVKLAQLTDERKYLLLRKLMPFAVSPERKNRILSEMGNLKTYEALFFVGGFLYNPETSETAARSVTGIALPAVDSDKGLQGELVRQILERAEGKLTTAESEYDREMINKYLNSLPEDEGFKPMFNGKDLTGWKGLVENPIARSKMKLAELAKRQAEADRKIPESWTVSDGCIVFNGSGDNLCTVKQYADFEMLVDWKITKDGDSGIYLRGTPQVQIWDTSRTDVGAEVGSGGLYNNKVNPSKPLMVADNPVGDWNTFRILMIGEKVSVWLNGDLVTDNVTMENYWDPSIPIFPKEQIELQAHGTNLEFRDLYIREIKSSEKQLSSEEMSF
jgi:HEAT repeat protein